MEKNRLPDLSGRLQRPDPEDFGTVSNFIPCRWKPQASFEGKGGWEQVIKLETENGSLGKARQTPSYFQSTRFLEL